MAIQARRIVLNIQPNTQITARVNISQYDVGVPIEFELMDGGLVASLPSGATAKVHGTRPSGVGFSQACTINDNILTVYSTTSMSGEAGQIPAEVVIEYSGDVIGTANFFLNVERSPHKDGTIDSDIIIQAGLVERVETLEDEVDQNTGDITDLEGEVSDLKEDFDDLNEFVRKEIVKTDTGEITVTRGIAVPNSTHLVDVAIPNGTTYEFTLNGNGCVDKYHLYANQTAVRYNCEPNTTYQFTASADITWFSVYIASANILDDGTISATVSVTERTSNSLEERIDDLENDVDKIDMLESFFDISVKAYKDSISVGANLNNDGNAKYIYHDVAQFDVSNKDVVGIKLSNIINNIADPCVYVYSYDSSNNIIFQKPLTKEKVLSGCQVYLPDGSVKAAVSLYPSTTGGLTDTYATYSDVIVFTSSDGYVRPIESSAEDAFVLPAYYFENNYLQNKIADIRGYMENADGDYDAFIFCTDQHWRLNAKQSPKLIRYIANQLNIPRLFMGGDYADGIYPDAYEAFKKAFTRWKIYNVAGNHEYMNYFTNENGGPTTYTVKDGTVWAYLNGGLTDVVVGEPSRSYYYVDNNVQKIRYIILNDWTGSPSYLFEQDQIDWFDSVLTNMPSDYKAVVFIHAISEVNHTTGALSGGFAFDDVESVLNNHTNVICVFGGHTHFDGLGTIANGVPVFVTTCDKYLPVEGYDDYLANLRTVGTTTEQAFDVVVIDKTNRKVSAVRIGCPANNPSGEPLEIRQLNY